MKTHLTITGFNAGDTFCGASREMNGKYVHGMYAPLDKPEFRAECCEKCLHLYAQVSLECSKEDSEITLKPWEKEILGMSVA